MRDTAVGLSLKQKGLGICFLAALAYGAGVLQAMPPVDGGGGASLESERRFMKEIDMANPLERARIERRHQWQKAQRALRAKSADASVQTEPLMLRKTGVDRVLVILVEFEGTNTFTWTPGVSTWDPLGRCDNSEYDGVNLANSAASQFLAQKHGITAATNFTYSGPLHNEIARPRGTNDPSATMIWQPDFALSYYSNIIFGMGVNFDYTREDGSVVRENFPGRSVRDYYEDISAGAYSISGNVLGWVKVTNSVWYYGADGLPGARSTPERPSHQGAIPGAGNAQTLVIDALRSAKAAYPGFDWASYDADADGLIDRLWIIHAGLGEEDNPGLLNRTSYGEAGLWSHSWSLGSPLEVVPGVSALSYIMMPENAGIAVLAHEFAHNLGAIDLYSYGEGHTSAGFWTLMADSWVGFPLGFLPQAIDPMHLDDWGWLQPITITDPTRVYSVNLGQASEFPTVSNRFRAAKIELPAGVQPLPVRPYGLFQWWGGKENMADAQMTLRQPITIPSAGATLEFQAAYDTESGYDFFYVEVSSDSGSSWQKLATNQGRSAGFPSYQAVSFSLAAQAGQAILLRFRYVTDSFVLGEGVFVDDIVVRAGTQVLLTDDGEQERNLWSLRTPWTRNNGVTSAGFTHSYYLQWRNTSVSGGYDQALGDRRFRFGPGNTGLIVWYQDDRYGENSIFSHLHDSPSFGPKGKLLVVDSHPEPQLDPYWVAQGVTNERGNVFSRGAMRDAPFSRWPTADYHLEPPFAFQPADFAGRSAQPEFSDALGYYPGIERLPSGRWRTRQWDASVVVPAQAVYSVRGEGYSAGAAVEQIFSSRSFIGTEELILYRTNSTLGGIAQDGGDGNPGTHGAAFGWNVRVVWQTNETADVVIWNTQAAKLDTDQDGVPDWQEALSGTDPNDGNSRFQVTRVEPDPVMPSVLLEWTSASNRVYRITRTDTLGSGFAAVVATNVPATPPRNLFIDSRPAPARQVFYRVELE